MLDFLPEADLSSAVTFSTPLASTSKVTSTGGVPRDQGGHDATSGLETHGQRRDVQQKDVLVTSGTASQNVGLDSGAICNSLVRVDGATWLLAVEVVGDQLL